MRAPSRRCRRALDHWILGVMMMPVEISDADCEASDCADARGFVGEAEAHAAVEDQPTIDLIGGDGEREHCACLRVVARETAQFALQADALRDVARGGERGLPA